MAKISDAYDAIIRGVSQQPPDKRISGQHWVQDDFLSDPVQGLRRRPGARRLSEYAASGTAADISTNFRNFDTQLDGRQLSILARMPRTSGSAQPVFAHQRGDIDGVPDAEFLDVLISDDARDLLDDGINAVTAVGKYLLLAHTQPVDFGRVDLYESDANRRRIVINVKGATYSREYRIRMKRAGQATEVNVVYSTPNLYNTDGSISATAAAAAQPFRVAQQLLNRLNANATFTAGFTAVVDGASIMVTPNLPDVEYVTVSDGGGNELIAAAWRVVENPGDLPAIAEPGHIIKVTPRGEDSYYLRAESDLEETEKVIWREYTAAEVSIVRPFAVGVAAGNRLLIGADPADLQALLDAEAVVETVPEYGVRKAGDDESAPMPHFVGREITDMTVFQDRLLVMSGPVVNASQISDFFNFWRTTVLTYPDDDATEMYATGSEADVIRGSVIFDRSLVMFGDKQQYAVSGKVPLTGSTSTIMQSSAHKDAAAVRPVALGDLLFFLKSGRHFVTSYQIRVGQVEDTSNSSEVSRQLNDYINGQGLEMVGLSLPEMLLIRTTTPNTVYTFAFVDTDEGGRMLDAWSRWTFDASCGMLAGVSLHKDSPRLVFAQSTEDGVKLILSELDLNDTNNVVPHLDLWFYVGDFAADAAMHCAFTGDAPEDRRWFGRTDNNVAALEAEFGADENVVLGYRQGGELVLTSPYVMDDGQRPITGGKLTVSVLSMTVTDSLAFTAETVTAWGTFPGIVWNGRVLGRADNLVGYREPRDATVSWAVAQDNTQYRTVIRPTNWLPLTITGVSWTGQYFKKSRSL
jgi:hypothetical protein